MKRLKNVRKKKTLTRKKRITRPNLAVIRLSIAKIVAVLLIIGLNWVGLSAVVGTFTYFNDTETAEQNVYMVGSLDMALTSAGNFFPQLTPSQNSSRDITVANQGSLDFRYKVKINNLSGNLSFCNNLNLKATLNSGILYDGSLAGFKIATTTNLGAINFTASSNAHGFNQACNFDLVFTAWQVNLDNENLGFNDEESISNSIAGGQDDVVLNEFLPNPIGNDWQDGILGEWVEFYNNSNHAIDMTGWYTEDAVGASHRRTISAATTYNGQTTIGAKGSGSEWLVLFMDDDILNNTSDTINLYDNYGRLVDTYSYSGSDYNINDTPGATNNLVAYLPFNNDLLDKSGNNNNGTNFGTTFSTGKIEKGLTLGSSNYVEVPDSLSLDITDKITLEAWVYPTAWSSNENSILTKAGDGEYGAWNLHYKTTTKGFRFELNNGSTQALFESTPSTALNTWYHVVGVYDGSEMKLYVNGVLKGSLTTSGSITTNNSPLRIGKQFWWDTIYSYWSGRIDEVKIYNRALNAAEVLEHYNTVNNGATSIPENKSFARIPDGTGAWVDPIPTPGKANVLEGGQEPIANLQSEDPSASPSFSETLESATSAITEFISGGGEATTTPEETPIIEETLTTSSEATTTPTVVVETAAATTTEQILPEETTITEEQPVVVEETPVGEPIVEEIPPAIEEQPVVVEKPIIIEQPVEPALPPADPPAPTE
ncbi:MAG: TasA family protein [Patescibacteria group bacterium]